MSVRALIPRRIALISAAGQDFDRLERQQDAQGFQPYAGLCEPCAQH